MGRLKKDHNNYKTIGLWKKYQGLSVLDPETIKFKSRKRPLKLKYKDLVKKLEDYEAVADRLVELYPDMRKSRGGYLKVMVELNNLKPVKSDLEIVVEEAEDWYDKSNYVNVSGSIPGDDMGYGIEYTRWEEWLDMRISKDSLKSFSELDIYCHCLWEMTWSGFSQEPIQEKISSLMETVAKINEESTRPSESI